MSFKELIDDAKQSPEYWQMKIELAVEAERERCARVAESDIQEHTITITAAQQETHNNCCRYIAAAIRKEAGE